MRKFVKKNHSLISGGVVFYLIGQYTSCKLRKSLMSHIAYAAEPAQYQSWIDKELWKKFSRNPLIHR